MFVSFQVFIKTVYTSIVMKIQLWRQKDLDSCMVMFVSFQVFIKTVYTSIFMKIQLWRQKDLDSHEANGLCCFVSCQHRVQMAIWMSRVKIQQFNNYIDLLK